MDEVFGVYGGRHVKGIARLTSPVPALHLNDVSLAGDENAIEKGEKTSTSKSADNRLSSDSHFTFCLDRLDGLSANS